MSVPGACQGTVLRLASAIIKRDIALRTVKRTARSQLKIHLQRLIKKTFKHYILPNSNLYLFSKVPLETK